MKSSRKNSRFARSLVETLESRQLLSASFVIHISVDGLRPDSITQLGAAQLPNFYRMRTQGSFTDNARTDYDYSVTLPNHTSMVTGRPVLGASGHGWTSDADAPAGTTLHTNKGSYIASVWDVVHDNAKRTGLFASKAKFVLYDATYDSDTAALQGGAPDITGADNGRDKIDVSFVGSDESAMTDAYVADMIANPLNYSMLHYGGTDDAGHASGWLSADYLAAVKKVDAELGKFFNLIDTHANLSGHTDIILTTDHGGSGKQHNDASSALDYSIPFYVWGTGVTAGGDLYTMNPTSLLDPAGSRPNGAAPVQPLRTADVANLSLSLLGLGPVPGSVYDVAQNIIVNGPVISNKPAAPTNLVATPISATQINLSWSDNAANETGYRIERSTDGITFSPLTGTSQNATSNSNINLTAGKTYFYRVYAINSSGISPFSNIASATAGGTTTPTTPAAPTSLGASATGTTTIHLNWSDNANNETGYRLERSADGVNFALLANLGVNANSYDDTNLSAGTKYDYRVQALGTPNNSAFSNIANATTQTTSTPGAPAAPTNLTAHGSTSVANAIDLSWTDNANNETGYKIERSTDGKTFYPLAGTGPNGTFNRNTNLTPGRIYYYRVYAINGSGNSAYSNIVSATTTTSGGTPTPPAAPSALSATPTSASAIHLTWTDNASSETGYRIERSSDGTNFTFLTNAATNSTAFDDGNLAAGTKYYYRVQAIGTPTNSAFSNIANATTQSTSTPGVPAAPTSLTLKKSTSVPNAIDLSWIDNASNETGYKIERSTDGVHFSPLAGGGPNTNFNRNSNLTPGKQYFYRVYAINSNGNSPYSNVASLVL